LLTKGQAKTFFFGGTLFFSGVFLWLTVDTAREVQARNSTRAISPEVVRGKKIWEDNNCMGCHTIMGEGAYYAPELTKVVERRGEEWIRIFIKDPEGMYPGQRRMVKYNFTDAQIDDVIAFLKWIGSVDLNGFPPKPPLQVPATVATISDPTDVSAVTQPQIFSSVCAACHMVGGKGGGVGPALDEAYKRLTPEQMIAWLRNPQEVKPGTTMPKLPLSDEQLSELANYLQSLGGR